jgi:hypothetical protein
MIGQHADHYFSLPFTQVHTRKRTRDSGFPLRLTLPTVAPGQNPGALRFVSLALHVLSHRAKGGAGTFQRGMFPNLPDPETLFL